MSTTTVFNLAPCCNRHCCSHLNLIGLSSASYCLRMAVLECSHYVQVPLFLTEFRGLSDVTAQVACITQRPNGLKCSWPFTCAPYPTLRISPIGSINHNSSYFSEFLLLCVRVLTSRVSRRDPSLTFEVDLCDLSAALVSRRPLISCYAIAKGIVPTCVASLARFVTNKEMSNNNFCISPYLTLELARGCYVKLGRTRYQL
jgi:hypothetical protein